MRWSPEFGASVFGFKKIRHPFFTRILRVHVANSKRRPDDHHEIWTNAKFANHNDTFAEIFHTSAKEDCGWANLLI
jgi:hypothetical protein